MLGFAGEGKEEVGFEVAFVDFVEDDRGGPPSAMGSARSRRTRIPGVTNSMMVAALVWESPRTV